MARISEFFGIVVSLFYTDHPPPHFHAVYCEFEVMIGIESIEILEGHLPRRGGGRGIVGGGGGEADEPCGIPRHRLSIG